MALPEPWRKERAWLVSRTVTAMRQWGDKWAAPVGPPLRIRHKNCGRLVRAVAVCSHCGEPLDARSVTAEPGDSAKAGDFDRTRLADPPPTGATQRPLGTVGSSVRQKRPNEPFLA